MSPQPCVAPYLALINVESSQSTQCVMKDIYDSHTSKSKKIGPSTAC